MNKILLICFMFTFQNILGQSVIPDNIDDLYAKTLHCYIDSAINRSHIYDRIFETLPKEQQFTNFLLVGDNEITSKIPDQIQFVNWTKMNKDQFCNVRKPWKKWDEILFIKSDYLMDSILNITILKYFSQGDDCDINYQTGEEFFYHFDNITNGYILDSIVYETYVIIM